MQTANLASQGAAKAFRELAEQKAKEEDGADFNIEEIIRLTHAVVQATPSLKEKESSPGGSDDADKSQSEDVDME